MYTAITGCSLDIIKKYNISRLQYAFEIDGSLYSLGKFDLNEKNAYLIYSPEDWDVLMIVIEKNTFKLLSCEVVDYGPQDRGHQRYFQTYFLDINNDKYDDMLIYITGRSFEFDESSYQMIDGVLHAKRVDDGCYKVAMIAKLWDGNNFKLAKKVPLDILKKYSTNDCEGIFKINPKDFRY